MKTACLEDEILYLKKMLKILHTLQICHCDIKSENIAWSPSLERSVFLDFGLSRFLKENIGEMTHTGFIGTFSHTLPEMKKLHQLGKKGFIDIYYNDVFEMQCLL